MKSIIIILLLFILALCSCENSTEPENLSEENEIRKIVLLDKFDNNGTGIIAGSSSDSLIIIYFVGIYEHIDSQYNFIGDMSDPDQELLNSLKDYRKIVKQVSESVLETAPVYITKDKNTGERGLLFHIGPIKKISDTKIEIEAGYELTPFAAECESYFLEKENNKWIIKEKIVRWVN